jgi:hypothetical protein
MFVASAHLLLAMVLALGLLQNVPEPKPAVKPNKQASALHIELRTMASPAIRSGSMDSGSIDSGSIDSPKQNTPPSPTYVPASTAHFTAANQAISPANTVPPPSSATQSNSVDPSATQENSQSIDIPYYYSLKQLSKKPVVIHDETDSIQLFLPGNETQTLILLLLINETGVIDSVEVEQSNLSTELINIITSEYGKKLRFAPGEIDGLAVKCQLKIQVLLENTNTPSLQR